MAFLLKYLFDDKADQKNDGEDNSSYDDKFHVGVFLENFIRGGMVF
ncbi:hypothetical protein Ataiwa_06650 [Algoriphagus taiwanensis]|uniref:Uncharacterized protein n=1 Tax=Algoriphagus taiwanensis TaxID=1445656 RepID=A0ABQ6PYW5_9BACT|nr:hypothetical protein Ataiwa_06650 [Algoriphagus taiwanensis]